MKINLINLTRLLVSLMASLWLSGCSDESLLNGYDCVASDGTYATSIEVSWNDLASELSGMPVSYTLERLADDSIFRELTTVTETTYTDNALQPGVTYFYRVFATYSDESVSDTTDSNSGFAMDAVILPIGSAAENYHLTGSAGPDVEDWDWYRIMAQEGWTYTVYTYTAGVPADTVIYLYSEDKIDPAYDQITLDDSDGTFSLLTYTFTTSGIYYLNVQIKNSIDSYNITMWHHTDMP